MRTKLGLAVSVVALVAVTAGAGAANPVLMGAVGLNDSFVITLADASGKKVTHLDTGTYTLNLHDYSQLPWRHHNFHLFGPGVDVATDAETIGDKTFTIGLVDGTYVFVCDPHPMTMKGRFTVGSVTALPTGKLAASISRASKDRSTQSGLDRLSSPSATAR
jgi:plastocyanin